MYINDLPQLLNKVNEEPIIFPNGTKISCLMYADNIVIISRSAKGLQNCLNELSKFCHEWKLSINMEKRKCITFQKKNRKSGKNNFLINNVEVKNTTEYRYLGMNINAAGSLS